MPVFTSVGLAIGATAATAAAVGFGATALAIGVGVAGFAMAGGFSSNDESVDSRIQASTDTGKISEEDAQAAAKKRLFRSGVLFTSPTGLDSDATTASAKLR